MLHSALDRANDEVARFAANRPEVQGMGTTLVACVVVDGRLYWISVGDSPLYLLRGQRMVRLNQEHSFARHMAAMVNRGEITRQQAETDPDRACLTSALYGAQIPEIDCRDLPLDLDDGDILVVAERRPPVSRRGADRHPDLRKPELPSMAIGTRLLDRIAETDHPDQDNVSVCVLKFRKVRPIEEGPPQTPAGVGTASRRPTPPTRRLTPPSSRRRTRAVPRRPHRHADPRGGDPEGAA